MYPQTEGATDDRRQVSVDEDPDRTRDDRLDRDDQLDEARRAEQHGDTPADQPDYSADQPDYSAGETADPDRTAEYGEPVGQQGREEYAQPADERGQAPEYADPAYQHDQANGSTGYVEPDRAERPGDEPAADASTDVSTGAYATGEPAQRAPQSSDEWQLFGTENLDSLRSRWIELQGSFVDDPRKAVEQAEQLVSEVVQTVTERFNERRNDLQTSSADTEELRLAMQRYRAFFRQLLGG
jgi:hypothetical protein